MPRICHHIWRSATYYTDTCTLCGVTESILEENHYKTSHCAGIIIGDQVLTPAELPCL